MSDSKSKKSAPVVTTRKAPRAEREQRVPPRVTHGTKVRFNIDCSRCGEKDTLPFVPKTQREFLCRKCAQEVFGKDWAGTRPDEDQPSEYTFTCSDCGKEDRVPFEPPEGEPFLCGACHRGEERPNRKRIQKATLISASKPKKRRKPK